MQARVVSFWLAYVAISLLHPISTWGAKRLTINWSSDWTEFFDSSGNPLSQGDSSINQDGAAVQLPHDPPQGDHGCEIRQSEVQYAQGC